MTSAEIAAYIGAAAWLPPIGNLIYRMLMHPKIIIIPEKNVWIGFTSYGPILNLDLAFSTSRSDAIVDNINVLLEHVDGDSHTLKWVGVQEVFSEIRDASGQSQRIEKEHRVIALKLSTIMLTEKFIRFQDFDFQKKLKPALEKASTQLNYLKIKEQNYRQMILESKEAYELLDVYKGYFWWKPGLYKMKFSISSPNKAVLVEKKFQFSLSQIQVDGLNANLNLIKLYYQHEISRDLPDYKETPVPWSWCRPLLEEAVQ